MSTNVTGSAGRPVDVRLAPTAAERRETPCHVFATFYSHYGAVAYKKLCDAAGIPARLMPVPRALSSSCGTCVRMEADGIESLPRTEETEQLAAETGDGYRILWAAEDE